MRLLIAAALAAIVLAPRPARADATVLANHLLVVFNYDVPDSESLARYYAEKRQIPPERVLGLKCSQAEEISRNEYNQTIRDPIDAYLKDKGWIKREPADITIEKSVFHVQMASDNEIYVIVLMRGIPLKIMNDPTVAPEMPMRGEFLTNAASVDSELSTLPILGLPIAGVLRNTYFDLGFGRDFDLFDAKRMILVARLDAPEASDVKRMIDDALWAEEHRLAGVACVDTRGLTDPKDPYSMGDTWFRTARDLLARDGWPVVFDDKPDLFPNNLPVSDVGFYLGWYATDAQGPFFHPPFRFARGAVAYHLHSFSAETVRSYNSRWVGPLLSHGAAASLGCVYEPYLDLTPHMDIFTARLLGGFTFVEAAYMSEKVLSWMMTVVGDPLYRPFAESVGQALKLAEETHDPVRDWLLLQQARSAIASHTLSPDTASLKSFLLAPGSSAVLYEGFADLLNRPGADPKSKEIPLAYERAMRTSLSNVDQIRNGTKAAKIYIERGQIADAHRVLQTLRDRWPKESVFYQIPNDTALLHPVSQTATPPPSAYAH